ncbi:DUF4254 domain-containing protein [Stieleria marina]|uniref:DUF4254 domain-containing protein n=1 Tax=Stieleria marina TaxID=1930275 RepID=A0A517NWI1_9BACT|nr:hypothetical protein K239x_34910 [Planctomycetes bacterium K23_9]
MSQFEPSQPPADQPSDDQLCADQIVQMQTASVASWHHVDIDNAYQGLMGVICQQHAANFRLWHQEDIARSPTATDSQIADVKRAIDKLNQQRNDLIEAIDDALADQLQHVKRSVEVRLNTETPGSVIDRLSIMALRLFHYLEQADRDGLKDDLRSTIVDRIAICQQQQSDLSTSLQELLDDLFAGRKQHRTYRQMKMYNDPSLNPAIYDSSGDC